MHHVPRLNFPEIQSENVKKMKKEAEIEFMIAQSHAYIIFQSLSQQNYQFKYFSPF